MEKRQTQSRASEFATVRMLRAKVAELEKLLGERDIALADTVDALDTAITRIGPWAEKMVEAKLAGVRVEIATRFGEAIGRINALDPDRVRAKSTDATPFKFASEQTAGQTAADRRSISPGLPNPARTLPGGARSARPQDRSRHLPPGCQRRVGREPRTEPGAGDRLIDRVAVPDEPVGELTIRSSRSEVDVSLRGSTASRRTW